MLDDNFEGMAHPFSLHVSKIRVGVALRVQERLSESIAALEAAYGYFRVHDARAFAWCAVNLALALYEAGELAKATLVLGSAMAVNASHGFHNGEMLAAYRTFRSDEACILSHPAIDAELDRLAAFEPVLGELGHELADSKLVEHVLLDLQSLALGSAHAIANQRAGGADLEGGGTLLLGRDILDQEAGAVLVLPREVAGNNLIKGSEAT